MKRIARIKALFVITPQYQTFPKPPTSPWKSQTDRIYGADKPPVKRGAAPQRTAVRMSYLPGRDRPPPQAWIGFMGVFEVNVPTRTSTVSPSFTMERTRTQPNSQTLAQSP